ncbi:MAG: glycosyltransferase family protein [Alphaproteobacteria bacterium]
MLQKQKILFISRTTRLDRPYHDPSTRYRCYHAAENLSKAGCIADVVAYGALTLEMVDCYDYFIFHRPVCDENLVGFLDEIHAQKKTCIADYDDLIFDEKNALSSSAFVNGRTSEKEILRVFRQNYDALCLFERVTTSTDFLKKKVLHSHPKATVEVIRNGLSARWVKSSVAQFPLKNKTTIAYFSGTKSHDKDFALLERELITYLTQHKDKKLLVVGPLDFNADDFPAGSLRHLPHVPYEELPALIQKTWVNIAPLPLTPFNKCKSGLKFFESAIWGIPSIVSPIPDMKRFDGSGVVYAKTAKGFIEGLERFEDAAFYAETADKIKKYAQKNCMSLPETKKLLRFLLKKVG